MSMSPRVQVLHWHYRPMHWGGLWSDFWAGEPEAVEAVATLAAVIVAVAAAWFAWRQIGDARDLRREQAEPDVVAVMESNSSVPQMVEFALKNFGPTPARNITVTCTPPMRRTTGQGPAGVEPVWVPSVIPYLAPGQEWRTTWDVAHARASSPALKGENEHHVVIEFDARDAKARRRTSAVLDWSAYKGRRYLDQKSVHHVAKSLNSIEKSLRSVIRTRMLRVIVRDEEVAARDERSYFSRLERRDLIEREGQVRGRLIAIWRRVRRTF